jgi:hypothetical protein
MGMPEHFKKEGALEGAIAVTAATAATFLIPLKK